jgi:hypothetical protein
MVLLKMGKTEELKRIASEYQSVLPPEYKRRLGNRRQNQGLSTLGERTEVTGRASPLISAYLKIK